MKLSQRFRFKANKVRILKNNVEDVREIELGKEEIQPQEIDPKKTRGDFFGKKWYPQKPKKK